MQGPTLGGVKKFDYGHPQTNFLKYGSNEPPDYDLSAINSTNIALIYSANDWINQLQDIQRLKDNLKGERHAPQIDVLTNLLSQFLFWTITWFPITAGITWNLCGASTLENLSTPGSCTFSQKASLNGSSKKFHSIIIY